MTMKRMEFACGSCVSLLLSLPLFAFDEPLCTLSESGVILATDAAAEAWFGVSVSVNADLAVIGAHCDTVAGVETGSAYVYRLTEGG